MDILSYKFHKANYRDLYYTEIYIIYELIDYVDSMMSSYSYIEANWIMANVEDIIKCLQTYLGNRTSWVIILI